MTLKKLKELVVRSVYYFIILTIFGAGLLSLELIFESPYYIDLIIVSLAMLLVPVYGIFYKKKIVQKLAKIIFLIMFVSLLIFSDFIVMDFFDLLPALLIIASLAHLYRFEIKQELTSFYDDAKYFLNKMLKTSREDLKKFILQVFPLIAIYILIILMSLQNGNYELTAVLLISIPLTFYAFADNNKLKKYLEFVLNLSVIGILLYWVKFSYGWLYSIFSPYSSYPWNICFSVGCDGMTGWELITQATLFIIDLRILLYVAIIYLLIKNKNRTNKKLI